MCLAVPGQSGRDRGPGRHAHGARSTSAAWSKDVCLAYVPDAAGRRVRHRPRRLRPAAAGRGVGRGRRSSCSRNSGCWRRSSATPGQPSRGDGRRGRGGRMKYIDEFQRPGAGPAAAGRDPRHRHPALGADGGVRRPDPLDHPPRHRPTPARRGRVDPRPGCPVCVTPLEVIDKALEIASRPDVIFCSLRRHAAGARHRPRPVPGHGARAATYGWCTRRWTPCDIARREPGPAGGVLRHRLRDHRAGQRDGRAPGAAAGHRATSACWSRTCGCRRRSRRSCSRRDCRVQAFLAAGHVCSVMGTAEYPPLAERYRVPIVVTGFEPLDILEGIRRTVRQLERGEHRVENAYAAGRPRRGQPGGAAHARGGLRGHRPRLARHRRDPGQRLAAGRRVTGSSTRSTASTWPASRTEEPAECRSGEVLQGLIKPHECAAFGTACTPRTPLGATMVSSEGACAAYYLYRRLDAGATVTPQEAPRWLRPTTRAVDPPPGPARARCATTAWS